MTRTWRTRRRRPDPGRVADGLRRRRPARLDAGGRPGKFPNGIDTTLNPSSQITGVSKSEADRIALEIQSGSLPIKFTRRRSTTSRPSLGKDSLRDGLIAGGAGLPS